MNKLLRTLIVDDEPLARQGLSDLVGRVEFLAEVGQVRSGMEALARLEREPVDLLLLDVQMPGLSGTDLLRALPRPPLVIFTTAHPGYAVEGFELDAVDYLLKPIGLPRFLRAALRARERLFSESSNKEPIPTAPATPPTSNAASDIFIREEGRLERIRTDDMLYAEAMQNYCRIQTTTESYLPLLPLSELEEKLPREHFVRIHRSYLVNIRRVEGVLGNQVRIGDKLLPISRSRREETLARLVGDRLL